MPPVQAVIRITGVEAVKQAFGTLERKLARKVIVQAERKALGPAKESLRSSWPVRTGVSRKSIRIKTSKGPRAFKGGNVALALMVGESGKQGDREAGIKRPWWAFLVEHGFHIGGKRIRRGGKTVGYKPLRTGSQVKHIPGKHLVRRALRSNESGMQSRMIAEILKGLDEIANKS
jgi:hypothetical protein